MLKEPEGSESSFLEKLKNQTPLFATSVISQRFHDANHLQATDMLEHNKILGWSAVAVLLKSDVGLSSQHHP